MIFEDEIRNEGRRHLPAEFNSWGVVPSPGLAAAYQAGQCTPSVPSQPNAAPAGNLLEATRRIGSDEEQKIMTCMEIYFDYNLNVFAVMLKDVRLGSSDEITHPEIVEEIFKHKYGVPQFRFQGGITTNLAWGVTVNITLLKLHWNF